MRFVVAALAAIVACGKLAPTAGPTAPRKLPTSERELTAALGQSGYVMYIKGSGPDVYFAIAQSSPSGRTFSSRSLLHHLPLWQAVFHFPITTIADPELAAIPQLPDTKFYDNILLRGDGSLGEPTAPVYVTGGEQRHTYPAADTMAALGVANPRVIPDAALRELPVGAPVPRPAEMYLFAIDNFHIDKTRSRHRDTVVAATGLRIGDFTLNSRTGYRNPPDRIDHFGDMDDGTHPTPIAWGPLAAADTEDVIMSYAFINSPSISAMSLKQIQWILAYEGLYGLGTRKPGGTTDPRKLLLNIGFWTNPDVHGLQDYITDKIGWHPIGLTQGPMDMKDLALAIAKSGIAVLDPNCDGPLAVDAVAMPLATLRDHTATTFVYRETRSYAGTDSPSGCGSNSRYSITWSVRRIGGLELDASKLAFGSHGVATVGYAGIGLRNLRRDRAIAVRNIRTSDPHFTTSVSALDVPVADADGKASATSIAVMFRPDALGSLSAQLVMDTDDPETPTITVPLTGAGITPCTPACDRSHCGQSDGCGGTCGCAGNDVCNAATSTCEAPACPHNQIWCDCDEPARCMPAATCKRVCKN